MFSQGSEAAVLPFPLDINERRLALHIGPDANDPAARFEIHALTRGGSADTSILMRLNHALLEVEPRAGYYAAAVPTGLMRRGRNELALCCSAELATTSNPIIVHEILAPVVYPSRASSL